MGLSLAFDHPPDVRNGSKLMSPCTVEFVYFMPEANLVRERALIVIRPHA
jgi:hypothetical protein